MKNRKAKYILGTEATAWAECVQPKLLQLHFKFVWYGGYPACLCNLPVLFCHCFDAVDCKNHS